MGKTTDIVIKWSKARMKQAQDAALVPLAPIRAAEYLLMRRLNWMQSGQMVGALYPEHQVARQWQVQLVKHKHLSVGIIIKRREQLANSLANQTDSALKELRRQLATLRQVQIPIEEAAKIIAIETLGVMPDLLNHPGDLIWPAVTLRDIQCAWQRAMVTENDVFQHQLEGERLKVMRSLALHRDALKLRGFLVG